MTHLEMTFVCQAAAQARPPRQSFKPVFRTVLSKNGFHLVFKALRNQGFSFYLLGLCAPKLAGYETIIFGLENVRFHDLRHSFATTALQSGVDVKTVSTMLGHSSAGFTLRTYTHVTRQMQDSAAEKMGNFMAQVM